MLFISNPLKDVYAPVFIDPFGSPVFAPKRKKLKGYQKNQVKTKKHR